MKASATHLGLLVVLAMGLVIRLGLLWMPGTEDMYDFRMWGAHALRSGLLKVYTWKDQDTLNIALMNLHGIPIHPHTTNPTDLGPMGGVPDYPPGNILILEFAAGLCRWLQGGTLRAGYLLNASINLPPVLFALGATLALWFFARKRAAQRPTEAAAVFWLNPALILTSPVLGYQDPIFAFFGLLGLVSFHREKRTLSALFLALSCLTKPQGIFLVPVLGAACWAIGGWRTFGRYLSRFLLFFLIPLLPYILTGRIVAPAAAFLRGAAFPALSAQTANAWWLVGPALRAVAGRSLEPLLGELGMVPQGEFARLAGFNPLWISLLALIGFTVVNLHFLFSALRRGERNAIFWAGALEVYGYTMLGLFVHENHLYALFVYAAPLLAFYPRELYRIYWSLSAIYGLNLFLFDGLGEGYKQTAHELRTLSVVDPTALVALANVLIFVLVLRRRRWGFDLGNAASAAPSAGT